MVAKKAMNDISFETGRWLFPANAQFDEHAGTLTLTGQKGQYHRATIKIPVDRTQREVFFSGDLYLEDIVLGDKLWDAPKLRIADGSGKSLKACNLRNSLENQWHIDSCSVDQFHTLGLDELTLEIGFQNSEGRFSVRLPAFSYQRPEASPYVFPYPVPEDTSVTLTLSSEAVVAFENDLLSSNSHFSWADYSWSDAVVRDAIKTHFPMTNMRFPGGTVGNYYDHRTDGYHDDPSTFQSPSREKAFLAGWRFGYPGYQSLVKEQNATATLMFNVMHDDVTATENRLKKRLNDQLPIKWIELGNENYFPAQAYGYSSNGPNNPDVNQYIKHTQSLTQAIRKIAPDIKIAANINHLSYDVGSWSETLSRETYYDATIMHNYISVWNSDLTLSSGKTLIDAYKKTRHNIAEYRETFGNTPVLISEWGVQEAPESFLSVLAYADVFMALLEGNIHDGVVQQAGSTCSTIAIAIRRNR
ncbi:hypothetical protein JCM19237_5063 [Photobacterium aphoticum]|uniref:Uncharacterized protein n=1 Tax=Photobacterium aphoticum TaxID=754436 RepID=A0A090QGA3_9GAMM|nr:hypothetical protein JCM19237_5063 [Photobacterium aphoticum]